MILHRAPLHGDDDLPVCVQANRECFESAAARRGLASGQIKVPGMKWAYQCRPAYQPICERAASMRTVCLDGEDAVHARTENRDLLTIGRKGPSLPWRDRINGSEHEVYRCRRHEITRNSEAN